MCRTVMLLLFLIFSGYSYAGPWHFNITNSFQSPIWVDAIVSYPECEHPNLELKQREVANNGVITGGIPQKQACKNTVKLTVTAAGDLDSQTSIDNAAACHCTYTFKDNTADQKPGLHLYSINNQWECEPNKLCR